MKCEIVAVAGKNPGIEIYGNHVTPLVHEVFSISMASNHMDDPWYHARKKANAFFQGGHGQPEGKWVFIEFWAPEHAATYVDMINEVLEFVDDQGCAKELTFKIEDRKVYDHVKGMLDFYEVEWIDKGEAKMTFTPNCGGLLMCIHHLGLKPIDCADGLFER